MEKIRSFADLDAWKEAHRFAVLAYKITKDFPKEEMFGLTSQLRPAAVSVTSNIAEGFGRETEKEKIRFYSISRGSVMEIQNQLILAKEIGFLKEEYFENLCQQLEKAHKLINGLIRKIKNDFIKSDQLNMDCQLPTANCQLRKASGFTMMEMTISLFIITFLIGAFLVNYRGSTRATELSMAAQKMTSDIRLAQNNTLGSIEYNSQVPQGGWGVHFDRVGNNRNYLVFADLNNDMGYDSGEATIGYGGRSFDLPEFIIIDSITTGNALDVTFVPPDPKTIIYNGFSTSTETTVRLKDLISNKTKDVTINFFGLIETIN